MTTIHPVCPGCSHGVVDGAADFLSENLSADHVVKEGFDPQRTSILFLTCPSCRMRFPAWSSEKATRHLRMNLFTEDGLPWDFGCSEPFWPSLPRKVSP